MKINKPVASILALTIGVAMLSGCSVKKIGDETSAPTTEESKEIVQTAPVTETVAITEETEETESNAAPTKMPHACLYNMISKDASGEKYTKVYSFKDDMTLGRDLCVLGAFPTTASEVSGANMGEIWDSSIRDASLEDCVRPGFILDFDTPEGHCEKLILRPSDITDAYWDYIETYIYDDIHQIPGAWYSHLLDEEFNDETLITSVKITAGEKIGEVTNLKLTVFLYDVSERDLITIDFARENGTTAEIVPNEARG